MILASLCAVGLERIIAVGADLHLWSDGVWFLLGSASQRGYFFWFGSFRESFFRSRVFTLLITQGPMVLAGKLGVHSLTALSKIYGLTLYSVAPVCLYVCTRYAPRRGYLLFPLLGLYAGTMNVEAYINTDSPFLASLYWPILFILLFAEALERRTLALLVVLSLPTLLSYESMLFFGLVFLFACARRWPRFPKERPILAGLALWYSLGVGMAAASILWPFDPNNRASFLSGLVLILVSDDLGARASAGVLLGCTALWLLPKRLQWLTTLCYGLGLFGVFSLAAQVLVGMAPQGLDVTNPARVFNLLTPLVATGLLLAGLLRGHTPEPRTLGWMAVLVGTLGFGQAVWTLGCVARWSGLMATLRAELATREGPIAYEDSLLSREKLGPLRLDRLHSRWPLLPLSVYAAEEGDVKSLVLGPPGFYVPFDPLVPASFPDLSLYGVRYDAYRRGLEANGLYAVGQTLSFVHGGNAALFLRGPWSYGEDWARWSEGQDFGLSLPMRGGVTGEVRLEAEVAAHLAPGFPTQFAEVSVNGVSLGTWTFSWNPESKPQTMQLKIPGEVLARTNPVQIQFHLKEPPRSPKALRTGEDRRKLGLAFVRLRLD